MWFWFDGRCYTSICLEELSKTKNSLKICVVITGNSVY
jgi:hypothetical protein